MTNHIPHDRLLPQDKVMIYDHGPADEPHAEPVEMVMHASDAKHAMSVDPARYSLDAARAKPAAEPAAVVDYDDFEDED